ncbi:MAG TPA: DUF2807 domain-containing protein [Gammaproteobacteria bacterium]|nr:DUF2807 domain-containing protein [Gammaproteobacteria bacterium]
MKLLAAFFCILTLFSCAHTNAPSVQQNLLTETWMQNINLNPVKWTRGASRWFFTGEPATTENYVNLAPNDKAMTFSAVKVPQFTHVLLNGCFQVQILGGQNRNSVVVLGPNDATRQVMVRVEGNTIIVTQAHDDKGQMANLKNVIVRIGVCNLRGLKIAGNVNMEGRNLTSDGLVISSTNSGNVLLSGNVNLLKINHMGTGTISVLGVYAPCLDINMRGSGRVDVSGRVGIRSINNMSGKVHIIGADSKFLTVNAYGPSLTTVAGYVNLKQLNVCDNSCVYIFWAKSNGARIVLRGNARVGLAGVVSAMDLTLAENARFGGQYLHGGKIYVLTRNNAHANISSNQKIFASASDNSSIYFFGISSNVSSYTSGLGSVVPVWRESVALPVPRYAPQFITVAKRPAG